MPLRRDVEDRVVVRHRVLDGFTEVERARLNRVRHVGARELHVEHERNLDRRRVADGLGQNADLIVEVRGRPDAAIEPGGIRRAGPHHGARFPLGREARVNRRSHGVDAEDDQRIEVVVERIAERRREQHRARGAGLVVVVHDDGEPLAIHHLVRVDALRHVHHVEVAVVVVADVLLIEPRDAVGRPLLLVGLAHVPVRHELHAVRVDERAQDDGVAQDPQRLGIGLRVQPVDRFDQLLRAKHLGRVQAPVDPDDRFAVPRELPRLVVGDAVGERELAVRLLDERQLPVILRRRDDRRHLAAAFLGLPDLDDLHALGLRIHLLEIVEVLRVVDEPVVVADLPAELVLRPGDLRRRGLPVLRLGRGHTDRYRQGDDR